MNRFTFTSLIIAQVLLSIHSNVANENAYVYNEIHDESFNPTIVVHEANEDDMKNSLGSSVINLADTSSSTWNTIIMENYLIHLKRKFIWNYGNFVKRQ